MASSFFKLQLLNIKKQISQSTFGFWSPPDVTEQTHTIFSQNFILEKVIGIQKPTGKVRKKK